MGRRCLALVAPWLAMTAMTVLVAGLRGAPLRPSRISFFRARNLAVSAADAQRFNENLGQENVLYLDHDLIVVDKPHSVLSVVGISTPDSLSVRIARDFGLPRHDRAVVHRLDYSTSGVIVYARNDHATRVLNRQFEVDDKVNKVYAAVVAGIPTEENGMLELPIAPDRERGSPFQHVSPSGKRSVTAWRRMASRGNLSLVFLQPFTGRTHQLRVHMASAIAPIIGDSFYQDLQQAHAEHRLYLHAHQLTIAHPRTGESMTFTSPIPFLPLSTTECENDLSFS